MTAKTPLVVLSGGEPVRADRAARLELAVNVAGGLEELRAPHAGEARLALDGAKREAVIVRVGRGHPVRVDEVEDLRHM